MNKVNTRALSVLILVGIALLGIGFYIVRYIMFGDDWASAPFNATVFSRGVLAVGTITDRNGVILANVEDGKREFADNADVRRSTLHVVGDKDGNIGTGALSVFAPELMGFNLITGSYSVTSTGRQISLTIDSRLNTEALRALDGRRGAVLVSNYLTGEILCMVSSPTFDPADPPDNVDTPAFEGVYVNRAIQSAFTPGSTFKLATAAAAIEQVPRVFTREFECTGELVTARGTVTCPRVHGTLDFERGMQVSCNIVYGELAIEMGADVMARYAERFSLSGRTVISGITTASGNFEKASPNSADLAWSGVGQFTNTVCPATMLRFVGAIANEGNAVELSFRERSRMSAVLPSRTERIMDRTTALSLNDMIRVDNRQSFPGLEIHAKSGTAQVGGGRDPHAWYVGYITNENYPLSFVVIVENGGGGTAEASPIANRVLQRAISG